MWAPVGDAGGSHAPAWWLPGGDDAQKVPNPDALGGGEHAMDAWEGPPPPQSDARSLENMVMASGKLGGVAGVFLGVHIIWWW